MTPRSAHARTALVLAAGLALITLFSGAVPTGSPERSLLNGLLSSSALLDGRGSLRTVQAATFADTRPASPVVVKGSVGATAGLTVKVSQTTNLVNQAIEVSWSGAQPTKGSPEFAANYFQIMQCWGSSSPDPTQCQFGGKAAFDTRGGINAASRQVNQSGYVDAREPLTQDLPAQTDAFVPFVPVACDGKTECANVVSGIETLKNPYYDQSTTNEVPFAATRGDGKGFEIFETQTYREAPGLGCGDLITSGKLRGKPRDCWLVIVPRGEEEVDGTGWDEVLARGSHRLDSSPLSASNWASRIVVPLKFAAVGQVCPIQAKQRPLAGAEPAAEAVLRWQPALCRNQGPVFSFTQTADAVAQRKLVGADPGMTMLTAPIAPVAVPPDRRIVYAPVAVSGISFGLMLDRETAIDAKPAEKLRDGERITDVRLTQRLAAKLLTQSYVLDVAPNARYLKSNPANLAKDPDFLALNPQFKTLEYRDSIETLVPIGLANSYSTLWRWIASDQDALDFLAGLPDPWGMRVNPFYQGLEVPRDSFSKVDPFCDDTVAAPAPQLCTLDRHPYAQDFHEAARSASRGDQLSRTLWDANALPPAWKKAPLQVNGRRHILALADTATAARFGLVTAKLRNGAGKFVAPNAKSLSAGLAQMRSAAVPGVLRSDPESTSEEAYPLTLVSYAVTAPNILTQAQADDYSSFIRYAAGAGQKTGTGLGNLPDGYLPLTKELAKQALSVAQDVKSRRGPPKTPASDPDPGSKDNPNDTGGNSGGGNSGGIGGNDAASGAAAVATPAASPSAQALPANAITKTTLSTPGDPKVTARNVLLVALTLGICALVAGLLLPRLMRRLGQ
jgi:hypothetical protein